MTMKDVSMQDLQTWDNPENVVKQLEKFRDEVQKADAKVEDIWAKYRSLPNDAQYLVAAHRRYDECGWWLMTKWQIVKEFDAKLRAGQARDIVGVINSAIATERKIVALEKFVVILTNPSSDSKLPTVEAWQQENPSVAKEVAEKVYFVGQLMLKNSNAAVPVPSVSKVVEKMLLLYKEGYPRLDNIYFS
jgi:hypothetical protein